MPVCQGRPNGPCPLKKKDRSVKWSIGDLWLCSACLDFRYPPLPMSDNSSSDSVNTSRRKNTETKPRKTASEAALMTINEKINEAIDTVISQSQHGDSSSENESDQSKLQLLTLKVDSLCSVVNTQQDTIQLLSTKLNFVLSMFGLTEDDIKLNDETLTSTGPEPVSTASSTGPTAANSNATTVPLVKPPTMADIVRRGLGPATVMRQTVLSTVYMENEEKKLRRRNFVVSGLPSNTECPDQVAVIQLCKNHFNLEAEVTSCRRLGKQIAGREQLLLVTLASEEQASHVILSAKILRKSADPVVRKQIYINANLTRAESQAAYLLRQQRRVASERRSENLHQPQPASVSQLSAARQVEQVSQQPADSLLLSGNNPHALNPGAGLFIPTVSVNNHFQVLETSESAESTEE